MFFFFPIPDHILYTVYSSIIITHFLALVPTVLVAVKKSHGFKCKIIIN